MVFKILFLSHCAILRVELLASKVEVGRTGQFIGGVDVVFLMTG